MRFTVALPWGNMKYDMTLDELVKAYAETQMGNIELEYLDGYRTKEGVPSEDVFVDGIYADIVTGEKCEICLDGTYIEYVFPESVRFETTSKIKSVIRGCYQEV